MNRPANNRPRQTRRRNPTYRSSQTHTDSTTRSFGEPVVRGTRRLKVAIHRSLRASPQPRSCKVRLVLERVNVDPTVLIVPFAGLLSGAHDDAGWFIEAGNRAEPLSPGWELPKTENFVFSVRADYFSARNPELNDVARAVEPGFPDDRSICACDVDLVDDVRIF